MMCDGEGAEMKGYGLTMIDLEYAIDSNTDPSETPS